MASGLTPTTATAEAARRAWELAFDATPPMPPGVALDYVQECTGDRDDACLELIAAAANYLEAKIPDSGASINMMPLHEQATLAVGHFRGAGWGMVRTYAQCVMYWANRIIDATHHWPAEGTPTAVEHTIAVRFVKWTDLLCLSAELCRAIEDAT